ncbi:LmeA family phospholipid-binding protein (plasmid) [Coraliomargarita sp. W4R53]
MASYETQPTAPMPEWGYAEPPKKRRWPWVVILVLVVVGAVVAWFAAEAAARDIVEKTIKTGIAEQLDLPADHEIDVEVEGVVIPQLIVGRLDTVVVTSADVPLGDTAADVSVTAHDVRVREPQGMSSASATVVLDEEQLRLLMSEVEGFPAETMGLADPNVTMNVELSLLGLGIPVGAALTPSAVDGELVLTPASIEVGGGEITADRLRSQFGGLADVVLKDWPVCVAQYLPAGVTLTDAQVVGGQLVADFSVDSALLSTTSLQQKGSCE